MVSGVAVLLSGTVEPGLRGTVTPGGGIGWRWLPMARFGSEAPDALRCMAFAMIEEACSEASAVLRMLWTSFVEKEPPGAGEPPFPCCRLIGTGMGPFGPMMAEFMVTR